MRLLLLLPAVLALAATGCGDSSGSGGDQMGAQANSTTESAPASAPAGVPAENATVDIRSFKFKPAAIVVRKGGRVRWVNSDSAVHTATADDRSFDTQTIEKGRSRTVAFTTTGTFPYHCDFHPFMKGTVVVK